MTDNVLAEDLRVKCQGILTDLRDIIVIVDRSLHIADLHKHINTFFYIETGLKVKRIREQLGTTGLPDPGLAQVLQAIKQEVRHRWQNDFMLIASPSSLHVYLVPRIPC